MTANDADDDRGLLPTLIADGRPLLSLTGVMLILSGLFAFFLGVTNGLAQVRAFEAALVSSKTSLDSNKLVYEVGVRINIDVLNAQQQLYTTQRDLSTARYDTIVNGFRLKAATGSLKEEDIAAVNALLSR